MLFLSVIDHMVHRVGIVNTLVDKLVSKFVPVIHVAASCPSGYHTKSSPQTTIKKCFYGVPACGEGNQCKKLMVTYYYYSFPPYICTESEYVCMFRPCPMGYDEVCQ